MGQSVAPRPSEDEDGKLPRRHVMTEEFVEEAQRCHAEAAAGRGQEGL